MIGAAGIGDEANFAERLNEAGRPGSKDDVAGERDIGAGAGCDAVDRADDRLLKAAQAADQRIVPGVERLGGGAAAARAAAPEREVLPSAEAAPGAGEEH